MHQTAIMDDSVADGAEIDAWLEFGPEPEGPRRNPWWRRLVHPVVITAAVAALLVIVGLVVLAPAGGVRDRAVAAMSVIGAPTDFFDAVITEVSTGACPFDPDAECAAVVFEIEQGPDAGRSYRQTFPVGGSTPQFDVGRRVVLSYRAPNARVDDISVDECDFDPTQTCDIVTVTVTDGDLVGEVFSVSSFPGFEEFSVGAEVEVTFDDLGDAIAVVGSDLASRYQFSDFERSRVLLISFLVFAVAVIALGRWRGVAALAGLGATLVIIMVWLLPAILDGRNPVLVALVGASAVAFVALYVSHGFSLMTTVALVGTLGALVLTTVLSWVAVEAAQFTGLAAEESTLLSLFDGLDIRGLVLAGMVLGAAGALDDVTVTQASAVWQLRRSNESASFSDLWNGGIRIGQHHIGSTVNTLLLAYLGASLPLVVLFVLAEQSLGSVVNSEVVAVEVIRTLVGSIGLVAAVPLTTWLAARVVAPSGGTE